MELRSSLVELLEFRASTQPEDRSHLFLSDRGTVEASLTFAELHRRASAVALRLAARSRPGDRALLIFPPGLDFVVGFFGCLMAGHRPNRCRSSSFGRHRDLLYRVPLGSELAKLSFPDPSEILATTSRLGSIGRL